MINRIKPERNKILIQNFQNFIHLIFSMLPIAICVLSSPLRDAFLTVWNSPIKHPLGRKLRRSWLVSYYCFNSFFVYLAHHVLSECKKNLAISSCHFSCWFQQWVWSLICIIVKINYMILEFSLRQQIAVSKINRGIILKMKITTSISRLIMIVIRKNMHKMIVMTKP